MVQGTITTPLGLSGEIVFKVVLFYREDLNSPFKGLYLVSIGADLLFNL